MLDVLSYMYITSVIRLMMTHECPLQNLRPKKNIKDLWISIFWSERCQGNCWISGLPAEITGVFVDGEPHWSQPWNHGWKLGDVHPHIKDLLRSQLVVNYVNLDQRSTNKLGETNMWIYMNLPTFTDHIYDHILPQDTGIIWHHWQLPPRWVSWSEPSAVQEIPVSSRVKCCLSDVLDSYNYVII